MCVPRVGQSAAEAWREELRALTDAIGLPRDDILKPMPRAAPFTPQRPRTTEYSTETGRLIPPPSRAMSRHASRQGRREQLFSQWQQTIGEQPEVEDMVSAGPCRLSTERLSDQTTKPLAGFQVKTSIPLRRFNMKSHFCFFFNV